MVAFQDFDVSLSSWILVFEDSELPCAWNVFINFDTGKIKVGSCFHGDFCALWNLLADLSIWYFTFQYLFLKLVMVGEAELPGSSDMWLTFSLLRLVDALGSDLSFEKLVNFLAFGRQLGPEAVWVGPLLCLKWSELLNNVFWLRIRCKLFFVWSLGLRLNFDLVFHSQVKLLDFFLMCV